MLTLRIKDACRMRGIKSPYSFMKKHGLSHDVASRLSREEPASIMLSHMMLLCRELHCTPNDLLEFHDEGISLAADHPLQALKHDPELLKSMDRLHKIPLDKLSQLNKLMDEME